MPSSQVLAIDPFDALGDPQRRRILELLGGGKRIFSDDGVARPLQLVNAVTAATGVLVCTYRSVS